MLDIYANCLNLQLTLLIFLIMSQMPYVWAVSRGCGVQGLTFAPVACMALCLPTLV